EVAELGDQLSCEDHHDGDQREDHARVEGREEPARAEEQPLEADFQPPHGHAPQAPYLRRRFGCSQSNPSLGKGASALTTLEAMALKLDNAVSRWCMRWRPGIAVAMPDRRWRSDGSFPARRQAGAEVVADGSGAARARVLRPQARSGQSPGGRELRHEWAPRLATQGVLQRSPHIGHD